MNSIHEKIAALLQKNQENGASEAEALQAMKHAQKLASKYGVTLEDIRENTEASTDFFKLHANPNDKNMSILEKLIIGSIAKYTDTKVWIDKTQKNRSRIFFFGYTVDVELANYILEVCKRASVAEWQKHSQTLSSGLRHKQRKSFMTGMGIRLADRLNEMKSENIKQTTGTELVVLKNAMVEQGFKEMGMKLKSGGKIRYNMSGSFSAGKNAANKVQFNRTVNNGPTGGTKMIAAQ